MRIIFFLFILLSPINSDALESSDILLVQILKAYDGNVLILNRGKEDAINVNEHIKLTSDDGFIARGICIKSGMKSSHWKIYRVVRPELVSKDTTYTLFPINRSQIPPNYEQFQKIDFSNYYTDWDESKMDKALNLQQQRIATSDLPKDTKNDPALLEAGKSGTQKFMERNFNATQFVEDFSQFNISLFASPITLQSRDEQEDINYGLSVSNIGQKYEFNFMLNEMQSKRVDSWQNPPVEVTSKSTNINATFDIKRITPKFSYFAFGSYNQSRWGEIYNPRQHLQGGPLGIKYHIYDGQILNKFDISYITVIDRRVDDFQEPKFDSMGFFTGMETKQTKVTNARNSFRLRINAQFTQNFSISNILWWRPYMLLSDGSVDYDDVDMENTFAIRYRISENLYTDFMYMYTYDITQKRLWGVEPYNHIRTVNLRYDFDI